MSTYTISVEGRAFHVELKSRIGTLLTFCVDGQEYQVDVAPNTSGAQTAAKAPKASQSQRQSTANEVKAPMPGIVSEIKVASGAAVKAGDVLLVIEAMKMENPIKAPRDGVIDQVTVQKGQEVAAGSVIVTLQK